ncbi:MFS transporter [Novosphingobium sp. JCM 18896]|uniref:MFS transporter n=1 Tax=Novosphingobium sp. JCM 18896 TaxID=2989731 RepID=UPI002223B9AF|nr:MFS transporter [Novosphingobium sp. JCM 18896]MCW1430161.1 MFS transporter [Novosphingobium sp. JCM 18896]
MSYLGELRDNAKPLLAASLGCGTSLSLFAYTSSVFAPHLVKEFGWSRAQFALIGLTMLTTVFILPFVGRFTDRLGVRRVAMLGTVLVPLCFVGYALQWGNFYYFMACSVVVMAVGSTTGPLVYSRLIAENFVQAQGLALTILNCVPAALAMVVVPALNWGIIEFGWRACYLAMGMVSLVGGVSALMLIRPSRKLDAVPVVPLAPKPDATPGSAREDYGVILRSRTFWIIVVAMFLCMLHTPLHASQMNIMLLDNGITTQEAATMVSIYAFGTLLGRIVCGLALDRYSTPIVTALSMGIPAIGLFLLGTDWNTLPVIGFSMFLVGLSVGAEVDIMAFLVSRYFNIRIYNSTLGLVHCVTFLTAGLGAGAISLTLKLTDSFSPFLYFVSATITVGGFLFLLLPRGREKVG